MDAAIVASWLLEFSLRPFALTVAALAAIALLRVKSPAARHAIWTAAAGGMLLLAAIAVLLPSLPVRVLPAPAPLAASVSAPIPLATPAAPRAPASRAWDWERIAVAVYLAGLFAFTVRLVYSYRLTRRLVSGARPLAQFKGEDVFESDAIAVPITLGWRHPKILLPPDWANWTAEKLEAVMVHERTHVARGDWAVALVAGVNRCVFWFHPLAWWIERRLALLAELACDDAALAGVQSRTAYAEVLVEMADAVRRSGGRVNWEAMAMARHSEVRLRVERILDESRQILPALTRARWIALLACALPLVYLAAAVRPARVRAEMAPVTDAVGEQAQDSPASSAELQAARQRIEMLEAEIASLKAQNPGDAPHQLQANRAGLQTYQTLLAQVQESITELEQRRLMLDTQLQTNNTNLNYYRSLGDGLASAQSNDYLRGLDRRIEQMRAEIAALGEQLTPNHPALKKAQAALESMERKRVEGVPAASRSVVDLEGSSKVLRAEMQNLNLQLEEKAHQMRALESQIETYQARMEAAQAESRATELMYQQEQARRMVEAMANAVAASGAPALIVKRDPDYTKEALNARIEGRVDLDVTVSDGRAINVRVVRGLGYGLDEKAIECVKFWRWQATTSDGQPLRRHIVLPVLFKLPVQK